MVIIVRTVSERVHLRFLEKSFSGDFATSAGERDLTREIRDFWTLGIEYFIKCEARAAAHFEVYVNPYF